MSFNEIYDLVDIYKWWCDPFRVLLLTNRRLKGLTKADFILFYFFSTMGFFTYALDVSHQTSQEDIRSSHSTLGLQISML